MNMGNLIIGAVTSGYIVGIIAYIQQRNYAQALIFVGAAIANVGAIWSTW